MKQPTLPADNSGRQNDAQRLPSQKSVLLVAYHFPPDTASTGRLRTLGFARYLPRSGWKPLVLSASPHAYEQVDPDSRSAIPADTSVRRAFALDTRRHLGWRGKYLSWLAVPDRWIWWWPTATAVALYLVRRHRVAAIWSTYPIATAHLIGFTLKRLTGLPWIADFRDPMVTAGSTLQRKAIRWIESRTLAQADQVVFTTLGALRSYQHRFPEIRDRLSVIPNGYDETIMSQIIAPKRPADAPCTVVHAGVLYRHGRNPVPFFKALANLKVDRKIDSMNLRVILRASGQEEEYRTEIARLELEDIVELAPAIGHKHALEEQAGADGLLLFQGREFNAQIPAKVYEYYRLGKPIIALTDAGGDTAALLNTMGGAVMASMIDERAIGVALERFLSDWRADTLKAADMSNVQSYSREAGAQQLAAILDETTTR